MLGQLQLRRLLQGRGHPLRLGAGDRGAGHRRRPAVGHRPRERRRGRADLARRAWGSRPSASSGWATTTSGRWGTPGRAGRARRSSSTRARPTGRTAARPSAGSERFVEIWNLVFMQYNRSPDGTTGRPAPAQHRHRRRPRADPPGPPGRGLDLRHRPVPPHDRDGPVDHRPHLRGRRDRGRGPADPGRPRPGHVHAGVRRGAAGQRGPGLRAAPDHPAGGAPGPAAGVRRGRDPGPGRHGRGHPGRGLPGPGRTAPPDPRRGRAARRRASSAPWPPARPSSRRSWPPGPARSPATWPSGCTTPTGSRSSSPWRSPRRPGCPSTWPAFEEAMDGPARPGPRRGPGRQDARRRAGLPVGARHRGPDRVRGPAPGRLLGPGPGGGGAGRPGPRTPRAGRGLPRPHPVLRRGRWTGRRHRHHRHRDRHRPGLRHRLGPARADLAPGHGHRRDLRRPGRPGHHRRGAPRRPAPQPHRHPPPPRRPADGAGRPRPPAGLAGGARLPALRLQPPRRTWPPRSWRRWRPWPMPTC